MHHSRPNLRHPVLWIRGTLCALALVAAGAQPAQARDERLLFPIDSASEHPDAQARLDGSVRFFWGDAPSPKPTQTLGTFTSNKKSNAFLKADQTACERAWLSAMIALQNRAKREGGNAVVGIHSVYRGEEVRSRSEYECGAGTFMAGVSLRGTVVKLP